MTPDERMARGQRAAMANEEFVAPILTELKGIYSERIIEVANTELSAAKRADKITALSNALKILNTLESGIIAIMRDGEIARKDVLRADKIETMTQPQRRLLGIAPGY